MGISCLPGMTIERSGYDKFDCGCMLEPTKNVGEFKEHFFCDKFKHPRHEGYLIELADKICKAAQ